MTGEDQEAKEAKFDIHNPSLPSDNDASDGEVLVKEITAILTGKYHSLKLNRS